MLNVIFFIVAVDEDVIEIDNDEDVQVGPERIIDEALEGGWGVGQAERHHEVFELAVPGTKCCFPLMPLCDSNEVVTVLEIDFGKDFCLS